MHWGVFAELRANRRDFQAIDVVHEVPQPACFARLNGAHPVCVHAAVGNQLSGAVLLAFRPVLNLCGGNQLHGAVLVAFPPDAVDPSKADEFIKDFPASEVLFGHTFLVSNEPDAFRLVVVGEEPLPELIVR